MGLELNRGQANPEILFLSRGSVPVAVTAKSIIFSPLGVRQNFVAGNPNPSVRLLDPLPGFANSLAGGDSRKWVTGIPHYARARLEGVYPGIDAEYSVQAGGQLMLKLVVGAGADPRTIVFDVPAAVTISNFPGGALQVRLGDSKFDPALFYLPPVAYQETPSGRTARTVMFEKLSETRFGFRVDDQDSALPLQIETLLGGGGQLPITPPRYTTDAAGNMFVAATIADAPAKDAPFPYLRWPSCGDAIAYPVACSDVAVYKFSKAGDLVFVSYLAGRTREEASFVGLAPDGAVMVTGGTDSADFPVTAAALQRVYAGPPATASSSTAPVSGDFFAAKFDAATGALLASTYFGGPNGDSVSETVLGADGSLYFVPKWLVASTPGMPVTQGALQANCTGDSCANGYAAHLAPALDKLLYGTYLPGTVQATAKLHSDGSVYYAGSAGPGFPTTPAAFQRQPAGGADAIVARLDPAGTKLLFATYIGGRDTDWILRMAVAPDGSVWVHVSSFVECCGDTHYRLVRLDARGERILAERPISIGDIAADRDGNLIATAEGNYTASPDAFLANACPANGLAYIKLSPSGTLLFATYLPYDSRYDFDGTSVRGLPILDIAGERFEIVEGQSMGVFTGCMVDAASLGNSGVVSPGEIVTLFGSKLGPREGVSFQLENGRVPAALGGTRVLVNGEPVPVLYASYWQVNAILPYSLPVWGTVKVQVESTGVVADTFLFAGVQPAGLSLFRVGARTSPNDTLPAAALNEDGTVNSPGNPAKRGSRVALFATGGGATVPPSVAGEVTPLEPRRLQNGAIVRMGPTGQMLTVEYAGAAPGLVAGVTQINIRLPDVIPQTPGFPPEVATLGIETPGVTYYPGTVTIAVAPN